MDKFHRVFFTLVSLSLVLVASQASALTLDFSSGVYTNLGNAQAYSESGYTFTTGLNDHFDSNTFPGNQILPGVPYLVFHESASNPTNNVVTLDFGGAAFDLLSFDLINEPAIFKFNPIINPQMNVVGSNGSSLVTPFGAAPGFSGTVIAGLMGVTSVTFDIILNSTAAGNVLMDNVSVRPSAVPLPSIALLFLSAFGALGLTVFLSRPNKA